MVQSLLGAARMFASHYQLVVCEDPKRKISEDENWTDAGRVRGFAGAPTFRMVGTEADLNDHWVELVLSSAPPARESWQRITCVDFFSDSGDVCVMSIIDTEPQIFATVEPGEYAAYFAAQNLGIDQLSLGELSDDYSELLSDEGLAARKDVEWYRIYLVPGFPTQRGRLVDRDSPLK